ncbi:MAG: hypothetical protein JXB19_08705 [Bacteroidales bacterium]|nr:hypothetical protein [Bacteroidales bacterium]
MHNKRFYKNICISEIGNDVLVYHFAESKLQDEELFITGLAQFIELVGYKKPAYIIIDKKESHIQDVEALKEFLKHQGVDELIDFGVKKIFFVVSEQRYHELKGNVGYRGIQAFIDFDTCLQEIEKHRKSYHAPEDDKKPKLT